MKYLRNLTFLLVVLALVIPVPVLAGVLDNSGSSHVMFMDDGTVIPCNGDMSKNNDSDMDCKDDCASLCVTITSSVFLPSLMISNSVSNRHLALLIDTQNFQSVFPESIKYPPISIS